MRTNTFTAPTRSRGSGVRSHAPHTPRALFPRLCTVRHGTRTQMNPEIELQSTVGEHGPLIVRNHNPLRLLKYQP